MSDVVREVPSAGPESPVLQRLPTLDRFLPLWIGAAMLGGLLLSRALGFDYARHGGLLHRGRQQLRARHRSSGWST